MVRSGLKPLAIGRMDFRQMARKGKNDNLKSEARSYEGERKKGHGAVTPSCGFSENINPCLIDPNPRPLYHNPTATDRFSQLKRLFKKEFGYKPTGKDEAELESFLQTHYLRKYGTPDLLLE